MSAPQILTIAIAIAAVLAFITVVAQQRVTGNALFAAVLSAAFGGFTAVQLWQEGPVMFWTNHSANLTGVQVWWDLVSAVMIGLFLIIPRARAAGMNVLPWAIFVICTASIGLLAMAARLFWLESQAKTVAAAPASAPATA
jgi:hypothetical protein